MTPRERQVADAKRRLADIRVPTAGIASGDDTLTLLATFEDHAGGKLPQRNQQDERYEALKRAGLHALGAKVVEGWRTLALRAAASNDGSVMSSWPTSDAGRATLRARSRPRT